MSTRADQIFERCSAFHKDNPLVWTLFENFTLMLIRSGKKRHSVDAVWQKIRWHYIETTGEGGVKLNNDYRAYYARAFIAKYPEHAGFYEVRRRRSEDVPAHAEDIVVFNDGRAGDESTLMARLLDIANTTERM